MSGSTIDIKEKKNEQITDPSLLMHEINISNKSDLFRFHFSNIK